MEISGAALRYLQNGASNYDNNGNRMVEPQSRLPDFRRYSLIPIQSIQRPPIQLPAFQRPSLITPSPMLYEYEPMTPYQADFVPPQAPRAWKKPSKIDDQTFVIETVSRESRSFPSEPIHTDKNQLSFVNSMEDRISSGYFSNCKTDSGSTLNFDSLISPQTKRRKIEESDFFESNLKPSSSMDVDEVDDLSSQVNTEYLFGENSLASVQIKRLETKTNDDFSLDTFKSSVFSRTVDGFKNNSIFTIDSNSSISPSSSQPSQKPNFDMLNSLLNKKVIEAQKSPHVSPEFEKVASQAENIPSQVRKFPSQAQVVSQEKKVPSQKKAQVVSQVRKISSQIENEENLIQITIDFEEFGNEKVDTFYSTNFTKPKQDVPNIDKQNPSRDSINKFLSVITVTSDYDDEMFELGNENQNIHADLDESDDDYYGDILQSLEEIEQSFANPMNFTTSTPERVNRFIKEEMIEQSEVKVIPLTEQEEFVQISESNNQWTQITHISASIPLDCPDNYEFALNSVLTITQRISEISTRRTNESQRIDSLLTMIQEQNLFDETLLPVNADKSIAESRRAVIMAHIEGLIQTLLTSLSKGKPMMLKIFKVKDFKDCEINNAVLSQKETSISPKTISFTNKNTARTFTILTNLLCEIYKLLSKNMSCTKRELYYRDTDLMVSQNVVNKAIEDICILLNVSQWELGILSSSKGLMAGDLQVTLGDDVLIDCNIKTYAVPQNPSDIKSVQSSASFILVVEKDTVFTKLIQEKIFEKSQSKIIMVTAKGYPDINTRVLLKRLETDLRIPIYILCDADPHGIEIMCTYKFGSLQMVHNSQQLAVSSIEWIGVYPSDIETLNIAHTEMTAAELKKVDELLERPYMNAQLKRELTHLKTRKLKAEIENIYKCSIDYLIKDYIPQKIRSVDEPLNSILNAIHGEQVDDIF